MSRLRESSKLPRIAAVGKILLATFLFSHSMMAFTKMPEIQAKLTEAPYVPPPITRKHSAKVIINLETVEQIGRLADGVEYTFWSFGENVPGSFIRVREGDEIEFHLHNRGTSKMPHNIDLHAVTGAGGGAASSFTAPGHSSQFSFKVLNPGLYVYHCATAPVGMHIANGMYGMILVEPKAGLPKVDREYYLMQSEFYTVGSYGEEGLQSFNMEKALSENPDYVVFNGSVGSLVGEKSIKANVGETVRLYVGNGGPNLVSSFHVIGEIFDNVYVEGGSLINHNVQSTLIPAGGATIVEFKVDVPGELVIVDHSIFRAFNKGALGIISVSGKENKTIYSGKQKDTVYLPEGGGIQSIPGDKPNVFAKNKAERITLGERVYQQNCAACHMAEGQGIPNAFPPLAGSDYLLSKPERSINVLLKGLTGKISVNGKAYNGVMPAVNLGDEQMANVLTYILNSWNNNGGEITPAQISKKRAQH